MVKVGEFYRHYKGNLYRVLNIAKHTETDEELVIYMDSKHVWARPLTMFEEKVIIEGKEIERFKLEKNIWDNLN